MVTSPAMTQLGRALLALSALTYIACLAMPAYRPTEGGTYYGWAALVLGPIGLFGGHFSWLANTFLVLYWIAIWREKYGTAVISSVLAMCIALTFLRGVAIPVGSAGSFPYEVLFGYYTWLTSIALACGGAGVCLYGRPRKNVQSAT